MFQVVNHDIGSVDAYTTIMLFVNEQWGRLE